MAPRTTPGIGLESDYNLGENGWKEGMDANLLKVSALVNTRVIAFVASLPGLPNEGDMYVVTAGGNANRIALRDKNAWVFYTPKTGYRVFRSEDNRSYIFTGAAWEPEQSEGVAEFTVANTVPNALFAVANPLLDISKVKLAWLIPAVANTGPVTLAVNGQAAKPLLDFQGVALGAGYLIPDVPLLLQQTDTSFRLMVDHRFFALSEQTKADRILAETARTGAEAAEAGAEDARDLVVDVANDIVSQGNVPIYATLSSLAALTIPAGITAIRVNGRDTVGDLGNGLLLKRVVGAAGPGRWASVGALWEVAETILRPEYFGTYTGDGVANDDDAVRNMFLFARRGHTCLFTPTFKAANNSTIVLHNGDILHKNGIVIESHWGITIRVRDGANPTYGNIVSELVGVAGTDAYFQANKFRTTYRGLYLDGNGSKNASGHGLVVICDAPFLDSIYTAQTPWCGIKQQHTGAGGVGQAAGLNMLHSTYRRIRVDNFGLAFRLKAVDDPLYVAAANENIDLEFATGVWIGASQNGKITDGWLQDFGVVSGPLGLSLGSAAGWHGTNIRLANVDQGANIVQLNRTHIHGIQIDDFGRGWDISRRLFRGLTSGRMLTRRAQAAFSGQIQCAQAAGATSEFTYQAVYITNPTSGILDCAIDLDFDMVLDDGQLIDTENPGLGTKAGNTVGYAQEKANERAFIGRLKGTMRSVQTSFDLDPDTRLVMDVVEVVGPAGGEYQVRGQQTLVAGVASTIAKIQLPNNNVNAMPVVGTVELEVLVSRFNGWAVASRKFYFDFGRDQTGLNSGVHVGTVEASALRSSARSSASRAISDVALTLTLAAVSGNTGNNQISMLIAASYTGTEVDTSPRVTWKMRVVTERTGLRLSA